MFTGIIEQVGKVKKNTGSELLIETPSIFGTSIKRGASVAVNGVCLTKVGIKNQELRIKNKRLKYKYIFFDVIPETLRCTNLGLLKKGDYVNLERALKVGVRFEGHIAQGHVDAVARIKNYELRIKNSKRNLMLSVEIPRGLEKYIAPKGSIAIDGISLTVVDVKKHYFTVAIIPHTLDKTIVKYYKDGTLVNIEVDVLAKYVESVFNDAHEYKNAKIRYQNDK